MSPIDIINRSNNISAPKQNSAAEGRKAFVAFGLKKVVAGFVIDDSDDSIGGKLEDALRSIPGVENVECISTALL